MAFIEKTIPRGIKTHTESNCFLIKMKNKMRKTIIKKDKI